MRGWTPRVRVPGTASVVWALPTGLVVGTALMAPPALEPSRLSALAIGTDALLAVVAAILATAAAILARIDAPWEPAIRRRLSASLAFYGLVVVPLGVLRTPGEVPIGFAVTDLVAQGAFALLLGWALLPPAATDGPRWTTLTAVAAVATGGVGVTEWAAPGAVTMPPPAFLAVLAGWAVLAAVVTAAGVLNGAGTLWRTGSGLVLLAAAHAIHVVGGSSASALQFGVLRLAGLVILVLALGVPAVRLVRSASLRERLRAERLAAERSSRDASLVEATERDHEIRNALTGLSGLSDVLKRGDDGLGKAELRLLGTALTAELDRLQALVRGRQAGADPATQLGPVLTRLEALWRAGGAPISLDLRTGLRVAMPEPELTQVLTNMLANCDRHAPGARVKISASASDGAVLITVADDGPGLAPGHLDEIVDGRYHDPDAGGSGIGLRLSARLLEACGGGLRLGPGPGGRGCVAEVRLREATPTSGSGTPGDRSRPARRSA